jgi:hypothetical protein
MQGHSDMRDSKKGVRQRGHDNSMQSSGTGNRGYTGKGAWRIV